MEALVGGNAELGTPGLFMRVEQHWSQGSAYCRLSLWARYMARTIRCGSRPATVGPGLLLSTGHFCKVEESEWATLSSCPRDPR